MCFLLRFAKYVSAPILSWLDVIAIVRLEIALSRSNSQLIGLIQEFANLFEVSLFSSMESIKLSRGMVQWSNRHGLKGWGDVEVEIAPSLILDILDSSRQSSIFKWFVGSRSDHSFRLMVINCLQSIKRARVHPNTIHDVPGGLYHHLSGIESLRVHYMPSDEIQSIARFQLLKSFASVSVISSGIVEALCQLPNLNEVHLLSDCDETSARLLFANPRLTALTVRGESVLKILKSDLEVKCQLVSLRLMTLGNKNWNYFLENHCASLTLLHLSLLPIPESYVHLISTHCPLLTDLSLPPCTTRELGEWSAGWPLLTALHVLYFSSISSACVAKIAQNCPSLVRLSLPSVVPALALFPVMEYLALRTADGLADSLRVCSLSHVKHFQCFFIDTESLSVLASQCCGLEVLRLGRSKVDLNVVRSLCSRQLLLQTLTIESWLSGEVLIDILHSCPKLTSLEVTADLTVTNGELKSMIPLMTGLKELYFSGKVSVWNSDDLLKIARTCRRLEKFYLRVKGFRLIPLALSIPDMQRLNPDLIVTIMNVKCY